MSGHSKWATIKRQKGVNDRKRGQVFTKLSKAITIAVRQGGGVADPEGNFRLRLAIEAARFANMPKENIERAILRATSKQEVNLEEAIYEGFGPGGFSVVVEVFTDNKQRAVAEIKNVFEKGGGSMGAKGSVMYQFERKGLVTAEKNGQSYDDIFFIAADCGAEDVEDAEAQVLIYTKLENLAKSRSLLVEKGIVVKSAELIYKPIIMTMISDRVGAGKAIEFVNKLEDLDDVARAYANFDIL